jgi:hypothetical protein
VNWYRQHFIGSKDAKAIGEASPRYTMYPYYRGVPERLASFLPGARLVYIVRHPIMRMISHYRHRFRATDEREPLVDALLRNPLYVDTSRYAFQLEQYAAHVPQDRILVVVSEQLRRNRLEVLSQIFGFLKVDSNWVGATQMHEYNVTRGRLAPRLLTREFMSLPGWDRFATSIPGRFKRVARKISHRPLEATPELPSAVIRELEVRLRDDIMELRKYLEPGFDGWGIG